MGPLLPFTVGVREVNGTGKWRSGKWTNSLAGAGTAEEQERGYQAPRGLRQVRERHQENGRERSRKRHCVRRPRREVAPSLMRNR